MLYRITVGGLSACLLLASCSGSGQPKDDNANLRKICQAYEVAATMKNRPPHGMDELKYILTELGDKDPEQCLTSPRDGQPYVILFGSALDADLRGTILAYEKQGAEGKRYVLMLSREIKMLTDDEFASATFVKGHRPAKAK